MSNYTQYDWASDRLARATWADDEDRLMSEIDRRMSKRDRRSRKMNHKHGRAWA